jgi:hypothetical protein
MIQLSPRQLTPNPSLEREGCLSGIFIIYFKKTFIGRVNRILKKSGNFELPDPTHPLPLSSREGCLSGILIINFN